jgi:hypothetical protein
MQYDLGTAKAAVVRELRIANLRIAKVLRDATHLGLPRRLGESDEEKIMNIAAVAADACIDGETFPGILRKL